METPQNQLETWAVVEIMGHQREVGYVTTQYFGAACMFKLDVPELPEREVILKTPKWVTEKYVPAGTTINEGATPGRTRFLGVPAIFALNPCDRETAMAMLEENGSREIKIVSLAGAKQLPLCVADSNEAADDEEEDDDEDDEDAVMSPPSASNYF